MCHDRVVCRVQDAPDVRHPLRNGQKIPIFASTNGRAGLADLQSEHFGLPEARAAGNRHCQVRFEDLVTRPEETLRNLCTGALNIEFHPEMAEPYRNKEAKMTDGTRPENRMHGDQKFLIAHQAVDPTVAERWKKDMSADMLDNPMRAMARSLGYDDVPAPVIRKASAAEFQETAIPRLAAAVSPPAVG